MGCLFICGTRYAPCASPSYGVRDRGRDLPAVVFLHGETRTLGRPGTDVGVDRGVIFEQADELAAMIGTFVGA